MDKGDNKFFALARTIKKPIPLVALGILVLFGVCKLVLQLDVFARMTSDQTYQLLQAIFTRTFWVLVVLVSLGIISYTLIELRKPPGARREKKISLAKLPVTAPELFGRDDELRLLDKAWRDKKTNIVSVVAWGGVGKTALINTWLGRMGSKNYRDAERVLGWSFYSQGAKEGGQASADSFIANALEFFGDEDPKAGLPWDKAQRLAGLIRRQRTLLVLDGVEPLQQPGDYKIKDAALVCLLKELAHGMNGLCVVTTRFEAPELKAFSGGGVRPIELEHLSDAAGAQLLANLGVKGTQEEREETSREFAGHALALTLLGRYLAVCHGGEIKKKDLVPALMKEHEQGAHARRVMKCYEKQLAGRPELSILRMLGLFDRPAEAGAIAKLRAEPTIKGLTDELEGIREEDWRYALSSLRDARLLGEEDKEERGTLDCHPLIREYFGERLAAEKPNAWKKGHDRLYEYYKSLPEKELPETLDEMAPLYAAVAHGCQAGRHQEALDEVYWPRIRRGNEAYSIHKLGAFGADLAALTHFFEDPWGKPVGTLRESDRSFVLNEAGFCLRALGRLEEAVEPMQAALVMLVASKDWKQAGRQAGNLSELFLTMGRLDGGVEYARRSIEYADKSGDAFQKLSKRTTLADALHQAGQTEEAKRLFQEAEDMQKEDRPEFPLLYSLQGFQYCDLLLEEGEYDEVGRRAAKFFEWRLPSDSLLDVGLDHLSLGRAAFLTAQRDGGADLTEAQDQLNQAVEGLRNAGHQDYLARGLLARAELYRAKRDFEEARRDLDEAMEIATRGGMRLHEVDCWLEYARYHYDRGEKPQAREALAKGKTMIEEMAYHRRDAEVGRLEALL